jgi:uncharacterized protein YndB with AHSA1/START domain
MSRGFDAVKVVTIDAPRDKVWEALTDPEKVRQYMHGANLSTDWKAGSPVYWRGEWKGQQYEDKGEVLEVEAQTHLKYTHWSPLGGGEDKPENYHTVAVDLAEDGGGTTVTLTQDNNATQEEADSMAENNWGPVLMGLKETAEASREKV